MYLCTLRFFIDLASPRKQNTWFCKRSIILLAKPRIVLVGLPGHFPTLLYASKYTEVSLGKGNFRLHFKNDA